MSADTRASRMPLLLDLLRTGALPAELALQRLNKALRAQGMLEISLRTLQHDLEWLRKHLGDGVLEKVRRSELEEPPPPEMAHHRWFYRLRGSEDVLPVPGELAAITEMEALALATARAQLAAPPTPDGNGEEGPLAEALGRLMRRLGLDEEDRIPDVIGVNRFAPQPYDPAHALLCLRAIRTGSPLRATYEGWKKPTKEIDVLPVRLVLQEGEPYLWAWDVDGAKLKSYKLSRVQALARSDRRVEAPLGLAGEVKVQVKQSFRGFANDDDRCRVRVRIAPEAVTFVEGRVLGGVQRWEDLPDGGARIEFNTAGKATVVRWLLPFGSQAEVEHPPELREWMQDELAKMTGLYTGTDPTDADDQADGEAAKAQPE